DLIYRFDKLILVIPKTFEPAYLSVTAGRFDRYLCGKMATFIIRKPRRSPGYAYQPTRKTYPPLRVPSPSVRTIPGKLEFRSVMVPHRSYVGTIDPGKKIDV